MADTFMLVIKTQFEQFKVTLCLTQNIKRLRISYRNFDRAMAALKKVALISNQQGIRVADSVHKGLIVAGQIAGNVYCGD